MKLARRLGWVLGATALLSCLGSGPAQAADELPLGVILPMTGPAAAYGQMAWRGIELAREIQPEVLGRKVKLILLDNKSDKVESSNAAQRLVQRDGVKAIIGALSSSTTLAAAPVAEAAEVPLVSGWATNPLVTKGKKWVFRTCFVDPFQGGVAARYAYAKLGARKAAMLVDISRDYSVGLANFFQKAFEAAGGKIVAKALYSSGDQEFSPQLGQIQAAGPDIIYLPGYLPEEPLIIRQARELGIKAPFLSGDAAQAEEVIKIGGPAVEGLYFTTHFDELGVTTPAGHAYAKAYNNRYGQAPDAMGALGYDAHLVVMDAIRRAGKADPAAIRQALEDTKDFAGATGVMTLTSHDAVKPAVIMKVDQGKFVFVDTVHP
ncbi:MAG: ABC transporter substrate-binding protein [Deltaproteobacteria bacterium]|nr:ABC transporter substrate-binding protein [Deltaproteobacteria bacterium]